MALAITHNFVSAIADDPAAASAGWVVPGNWNAAHTITGSASVAQGGTGTSTAFTAGSVVFAGASGVYTEDNSNFFWDDTNNILKIKGDLVFQSSTASIVINGGTLFEFAVAHANAFSMNSTVFIGNSVGTIGNAQQLVINYTVNSGSAGPCFMFNANNINGFFGMGPASVSGSDCRFWFGQVASPYYQTAWDTSTTASHQAYFIAYNGYIASGLGGTEVIKLDPATKTINQTAVTVANLPAAGTVGRLAFVTDANATTFASVVAGGGANKLPVYDDGTNWRIG